MKSLGFTISGYTTSYNCIAMEYPFRECVQSMLNFCDEVVVVDAGSTDGSIEEFQAWAKREPRLKFFVEPVDFSRPRWAIECDGNLKGKARARCTSEYCWQMDMDEIVPEEDAHKIQKLPALLGKEYLLWLPMVEFWGSFEYIRGDFFTWKARFSRNDNRIIHGIPKISKLFDPQGGAYIRPFESDGCNYIWRECQQDVPPVIPISKTAEELRSMSDQQYDDFFHHCLDEMPFVLHVSWLDLRRKIRHYKKHWQKFHQSMYNLAVEDNAQTNVMFDKAWCDVTEAEIEQKAQELKRIGPRSFHHKIDPSRIGRTVPFRRKIPDSLRAWAARVGAAGAPTQQEQSAPLQTKIVVSSYPLVSMIIPSYNKAQYLPESVGSAIAQDYPHIEIIVVNDGSPDNTSEVVKKLASANKHRPIVLYEKRNGGISDARNYAVERAKGSIICALDGDDMARPTFVSRGMEHIIKKTANLVCSNVEIFGVSPGEWIPNEYHEYLLRYDNMIPTLTLYEKNLWEKTGGYKRSFPFVEDWEFFVSCSRFGLHAYRIPEKLFQYRAIEGGLSRIFQDRYNECLALVMTADEDLYPVDETLGSHDLLASGMPDNFMRKFKEHDVLHPQEWLLKFWFGLRAERSGNAAEALAFYMQAADLSNRLDWQPLFRAGLILAQQQRPLEAFQLLNRVRTVRPDMSRIVNPLLKQMSEAYARAAHAG